MTDLLANRSAFERELVRCACAIAVAATPLLTDVLHAQPRRDSGSSDAAAGRPSGPLWTSYVRAAEIFSRGVTAHGGAAAISGLTTVAFRWEGEDFAPTQGRVPTEGWEPSVNARAASQRIALDLPRDRVLVELDYSFFGGYRNTARLAGVGREFLSYDPSGRFNGTTYGRDTTGATTRRIIATYSRQMPALVLRRGIARVETLRFVGERTVGGRRELAVSFTEPEGDVVTLYFDATTHLLAAREDAGIGSLGDEVDAWRFSEYESIGGIAVPRRMEERWNGHRTGQRRLEEFTRDISLGDTIARAPSGYVPSVAAGPPLMTRVAEGIWFVERIGGGYRSLVVDTEEGLVLVDAPLSAAATRAAIALVERTLPGRPIRFVAITHHHGDHIGGIPAYAAKGATILAAPGSEGYLRRMATVPRTIGRLVPVPPDSAPPPRIESVQGRRTIGTGERRVEIIDVSPTSHASSMLVVWVPSQRLLFQGDLLRVNEHGGPARSPEATRDLAELIRRLGLDVAIIGSVHGRNATMADLGVALTRDAAP